VLRSVGDDGAPPRDPSVVRLDSLRDDTWVELTLTDRGTSSARLARLARPHPSPVEQRPILGIVPHLLLTRGYNDRVPHWPSAQPTPVRHGMQDAGRPVSGSRS
jgi:hypothetical protein